MHHVDAWCPGGQKELAPLGRVMFGCKSPYGEPNPGLSAVFLITINTADKLLAKLTKRERRPKLIKVHTKRESL